MVTELKDGESPQPTVWPHYRRQRRGRVLTLWPYREPKMKNGRVLGHVKTLSVKEGVTNYTLQPITDKSRIYFK